MSIVERVEQGPPSAQHTRPENILVVDIERIPGVARFWDLYRQPPSPRDVVRSPRMICAAWRWYGRRRIEFAAEWDAGGTAAMLAATWAAYDRADVVVTYNGISFDDRHLRSEWLQAGMQMPSPWRPVDLFREVRRSFGFECKSLDVVAKRLGLWGKVDHYDVETAEAAVAGNLAAQARLRRYNRGDIAATEALYDRLRGWLPGHPHVGDRGDGALACNQCGSTSLTRAGWYRAQSLQYPQWRCDECGGLVRSVRANRRIAEGKGVR